MECHDVREQLPSYAARTLELEVAASVDIHLAACEECRRLADEYVSTLDELPGAVAAASGAGLPASLKRRVMQAAVAAPAPAAAGTLGGERPIEGPNVDRDFVAAPTLRWRRLVTPRLAAAALAAVLVVAAISWSGYLSVALGRERNSRQELAELLGMQEVVLEVIDSNRTTRVMLRAQEPGSTAYGKLYTRSDFADVVAMAGRLPVAMPGEAYYLWLLSNGQTRLAGQMTVNDVGFGMIVFKWDQVGPQFDEALVTRQAQPSESPSGTHVLAWTR